jgi:hypothetical protein
MARAAVAQSCDREVRKVDGTSACMRNVVVEGLMRLLLLRPLQRTRRSFANFEIFKTAAMEAHDFAQSLVFRVERRMFQELPNVISGDFWRQFKLNKTITPVAELIFVEVFIEREECYAL